MSIEFKLIMFLLGATMGSFLVCQAWRLHYGAKGKKLGRRSVCLKCGYRLSWFDNIPILSWLLLGGKCRKCQKKIGLMELLAELGAGLAFLGLAMNFRVEMADGLQWMRFGVMILFVVSLLFLAIYDGKWGQLPEVGLIISGFLAVALWVIRWWGNFSFWSVIDVVGAVLILGGTYLILYLISKGKWVGDGDWILGGILGIAIGETWLALIILFLANFFGSIIMAPLRKKKIHFGPFLVLAFLVALVFAEAFRGLIGI